MGKRTADELASARLVFGLPRVVSVALLFATFASFFLQSSGGGGVFTSRALADTSGANATVSVGAVCRLSAETISPHYANLVPGVYSGSFTTGSSTPYADGIGTTKLTAFCNDNGGYSIYAIGYTNDTEGTTTLVGQSTNQTIATGTATSGNTSNWAMKVTKVTDSTVSYNPANLTIEGGYDSFHAVPDTYTKVASYTSSTDSNLGSIITTTYAAYIEPSQVADTYVGKVKYTLVHPSTHDLDHYYINFYANGGTGTSYSQEVTKGSSIYLKGNHFTNSINGDSYYFKGWTTTFGGTTVDYRAGQQITPTSDLNLYAVWAKGTGEKLYDVVASLNNGRELTNSTTNSIGLSASAGIKAGITTDNSGVFIYNPATFGEASDASNDYAIYLYRGILDDAFSSTDSSGNIGSSGDSANYPNYVKLGETCWRIVRTTGSGGVKMIYNGLYASGAVAGSCANAENSAVIPRRQFNEQSNIDSKSILSVGYTFNGAYVVAAETTESGLLFGTNSDYVGNGTGSTVKDYMENIWFVSSSGISAYEGFLEGSAGYCNDRSIYNSDNTFIGDAANILTPYTTASSGVTEYKFGARLRNVTTVQLPSLTCPRNIVDLYTTSSATNGNKQLQKPAALLTADEASFAGSGSMVASQGSSYSINSFLRTGVHFWLLSPDMRNSSGNSLMIILHTSGYVATNWYASSSWYYFRPVVSLNHLSTISSGSGTASDPWEIEW